LAKAFTNSLLLASKANELLNPWRFEQHILVETGFLAAIGSRPIETQAGKLFLMVAHSVAILVWHNPSRVETPQ
jgi:hypothetical protein